LVGGRCPARPESTVVIPTVDADRIGVAFARSF
jgi:hypothetical protein